MLIDTHCHVNFSAYKDDADEVIQRSLERDIWLINVGSQQSTSERAIAYAKKYEQGVYAIVGLHPIHLHEMEVDETEQNLHFKSHAEDFDIELYKKFAQNEKVVGIGEMGIDYFHMPAGKNLEEVKTKQRETFLKGLKLAKELQLPLTVHTRPSKGTVDAYDDVIEVIDKSQYTNCVVHCFSGSLKQAKILIEMGVLLSFTGIVTFKNAPEVREIVKEIPLEKMMIETDAPYLSPEPHRGQRNEPAYVEFIARQIAEVKGVSFEKVAKVTTNTAKDFFNI